MRYTIAVSGGVVVVLMVLALGMLGGSFESELASQPLATPQALSTPTPSPTPEPPRIRAGVPFTAQAPLGQWDDPVFQDGCEEASILMAWHWVQGTGIEHAAREIQALADFQREKYGEHRDRSAADTAQLMRDYFQYQNVTVQTNISIENIKATLRDGSVAVLPMNGQALGNPHFTPPGPERHMLVVHGYDAETDEFITNDPGTRHGKDYRYPADVFYSAIRDYPTGYHEPIESVEKVMLVVSSD